MRKKGTLNAENKQRMFHIMKTMETSRKELFRVGDFTGPLSCSRRVVWGILKRLRDKGAVEKVGRARYRRVEPKFTEVLAQLENESEEFKLEHLISSALSKMCPEVNIERLIGKKKVILTLNFKDGVQPDFFSYKQKLEALEKVEEQIYWVKRLYKDAKRLSLRLISGLIAEIELGDKT